MTIASDAVHCAEITRRHARTFSLASHFLPPDKRRASFAVYAFCRVADDLVDTTDGVTDVRAALCQHERQLDDAFAGRARSPLFRELSWAVARFGIPREPLDALLTAIAHDLEPRRYPEWRDLAAYCEGVASTVGEICAHVFGLPEAEPARGDALMHARTLGLAMQLTNILRDVGEDAALGRCYLPDADLDAFSLCRKEILRRTLSARDPRWRALMMFEIGRARALYEAASPGLALVSSDARACATLCATGYAAILGALEGIGYDALGGRARVGRAAKAGLVWNAWRSARRAPSEVAAQFENDESATVIRPLAARVELARDGVIS